VDDPLSSMMRDALDIGLENLEILRLAKAWCKNATMSGGMGIGLLEQATGLPINAGSLRCDYAKAPPQLIGMQLAHSALAFYEANCVGCTYRDPGGEEPNLATWALEQRQQRDDEHARQERERADESARRAQRHQDRRRRLSSTSAPIAQILDLVERIDAEQPDAQAAKDLLVLADQEPESFGDDVLLDLRETAVAVRGDALMDAVLLVHERGGSSDADLLPIAIEAMRYGLATSRSGAIIARAAEALDPDPAVLERIIEVAGGTGHIIGGGERVPEPAALIRMFDLAAGAVVARFRALAVLDDRWARARALRAAEQLIIARPMTADDLMPSILDSLVMEDDSNAYPAPFAAAAARKAVGAALWASPEKSDRLIQERWSGAGVRERRRYLECYRPPWRREGVPRATTSLMARRALEAIASEDDELMRLAAETLDQVCRGGPDAVDLPTTDLIASLVGLAERTDARAIQAVDPDPLAAMGQQAQLMAHEFALSKIRNAIAGLGKSNPDALVALVAGAWEAAPSKSRARIVLVEILEEALKDQRDLALALPFISQVLERGGRIEKRAALNVLEVTSRWSGFSLPPTVSESALACLEDPTLAKYAVNLLDALTIPEERVTRVLESLLTVCRLPLFDRGIDYRIQNTFTAVRRFSRNTPYEARVQEILFDTVDQMYTTDAAELLSHNLPREHARWLPAAVRALHRDEDAQWWGVKDRDQDDLLRTIVGQGEAARGWRQQLVAVAIERLAMRGPHQAREIADVLASIGEHDDAAAVSAAVLASIADVPEKRGRRHHARLIEVAHATEAAIERGDAEARLKLADSIPTEEPSSASWGFEDLPFDISEPDPAQDVAARVRLRGMTVDSLTSLAVGGNQDLTDLVTDNRNLIGADREGTVAWAYVELLDALEHATQWRPARRRAEKDADRFREAARDRAREVLLKRGSWSWPEALGDAVRELETLDDPLGGVQRAAAALARCPVPFTSTSILSEDQRWGGVRVEAQPERVVILGLALDGVPAATLDHVPRNTLLRLDATAKVTGGWPEDAKALRISFVSDTTQRDLERGEIVIERGLNDGRTQVNLRANVVADHPVELTAAATFEGGASPVAPRLLGVTRLRLTTAAVESPSAPEVAAGGGGAVSAKRMRAPGQPGRPGWTEDTFLEHWMEAVAATPQPRTFASVAPNFRPLGVSIGTKHFGVTSEHLGDLHRKHGAPAFE
jgi:hypothetical protein